MYSEMIPTTKHSLFKTLCQPCEGKPEAETLELPKVKQTCEPRKKPLLLSIESWLVNRDPYNGFL